MYMVASAGTWGGELKEQPTEDIVCLDVSAGPGDGAVTLGDSILQEPRPRHCLHP